MNCVTKSKMLVAGLLLAIGGTIAPALASDPPDRETLEVVGAESSDYYRIWLNAGDVVLVTVEGDGDTDLDLFVWSPLGDIEDSDTDATDACVALFVAPRSGIYMIEVENLGPVANLYRLQVR